MKNVRVVEPQLKALANRRRLAILKFLESKNRASVGTIAEEIKLSFKATSAHLLILSACDLLEREQTSTTVLYSLRWPLSPLLKTVLAIL